MKFQCPYCNSPLATNSEITNSMVQKCPSCGKFILLEPNGYTVNVGKVKEYHCKKCGKMHLFAGRPPFVKCDRCDSMYITSENGEHMIDAHLLMKGDNEGFTYKKKRDRICESKLWCRSNPKTLTAISAVILLIIIAMGVIYKVTRPMSIVQTEAYANAEDFWQDFRGKNPWNVQIAGIKAYGDDSYNIILTEPAEDVTEESLKEFFKKYNSSLKTFQSGIGYDGWLKDVVVSINGVESDDIEKLESKLFKKLYGTDYKADFIKLDSIPEHMAYSTDDLNMSVSEEELRKWLITDKEGFYQPEDEDEVRPISDWMKAESGQTLLFSKEPGFVAWLIPNNVRDEKEFKIAARKFALDTDLILGAIKHTDVTAIIGRERSTSLLELPPLRPETLYILAATDKDELSQSYQRTTLFAGKQNGGKDWAPILLSDELWHTEYGNLLNVTDQMLKSWSENGGIDYMSFDYPKPVYWPFDFGAIADLEVDQLTYNWNTEGVGYVVEDDDYAIYALNRTGSLPVSYIPGNTEGISDKNPVYQAEEKAYDFFSGLSNTGLVRVVQYASMYQIFKNLCTFGFKPLLEADALNEDNRLAMKPVSSESMMEASRAFLDSLIAFDSESSYDRLKKSQFKSDEDYTWQKTITFLNAFSIAEPLGDALKKLKSNGTFLRTFADYLIDGDIDKIQYSTYEPYLAGIVDFEQKSDEETEKDILEVLSLFEKNGMSLRSVLAMFNQDVLSDKFKNDYVEFNADKSNEWMKCPTIVESWSLTDSVLGTGGHNLNSKITSFRVNKSLKGNTVREIEINGKKVIEVSPEAMRGGATSQTYLRQVGRLGDVSLKGAKAPLRPRRSVIPADPRPQGRGLNPTQATVKFSAKGAEINGKKVMAIDELFDELATSISEGKSPYKEIVIENIDESGVNVRALIDGVSYSMQRGPRANFSIKDFDFNNYTTEIVGDKAIIKIPMKAGELEYGENSHLTTAGYSGNTGKIKVKGGCLIFKVAKEKLQLFLDALREYFQQQNKRFDQFKLQQKLKKRGLQNEQPSTQIQFVKNRTKKHHRHDAWLVQEEKVA